MADFRIDDPCILFALHQECGPFLKEFRPNQRFSGAPCWARFCGPPWLSVLVAVTGVGEENTRRAVDWVLSKPKLDLVPYEPKLMLFAGFAGGLAEHLVAGDLILASEIVDLEGTRWPTTWPGEMPPGPWQPPLYRGRLLAVSHLLADPAEKRRLATAHDAVAADMESAAFARLCTQRGVPFGCLRAISDDVDTPLSRRLASILAGGGVSWWGLAAALLRQPSLVTELFRLAGNTRHAARQLGLALGELLTLTLSWFEAE